MPYISETEYQNLHHTIVRLSESNEKIKEKLTALETAGRKVVEQLGYRTGSPAVMELAALLGETK